MKYILGFSFAYCNKIFQLKYAKSHNHLIMTLSIVYKDSSPQLFTLLCGEFPLSISVLVNGAFRPWFTSTSSMETILSTSLVCSNIQQNFLQYLPVLGFLIVVWSANYNNLVALQRSDGTLDWSTNSSGNFLLG